MDRKNLEHLNGVNNTSGLAFSYTGLRALQRLWLGKSEFASCVATVDQAGNMGHSWSQSDILRRSATVFSNYLQTLSSDWPTDRGLWESLLPVTTGKVSATGGIRGRVDWNRTLKAGWPPKRMISQAKHRNLDPVVTASAKWAVTQLRLADKKLTSILQSARAEETGRWVQCMEILEDLLRDIEPANSRSVAGTADWPLKSLLKAGRVASYFLHDDPEFLAFSLLTPNGPVESLFQLSVMGEIFLLAERFHLRFESLRPLSWSGKGPIMTLRGRSADVQIWLECGDLWENYQAIDVHRELGQAVQQTTGDAFLGGSSRPDIVITQGATRCVIIECKFPSTTLNPSYVLSGVPQVNMYRYQIGSIFRHVDGFVVGPSEMIQSAHFHYDDRGKLGVCSVGSLMTELGLWFGEL